MASQFPAISGDIGPLLPREGHCPACDGQLEWGEVIRSCYGRKAGQESERAEKEKQTRKAEKKSARNLLKESVLVPATQTGADTDSTSTATDHEDDEGDHRHPFNSLSLATSPKRGRATGSIMMTAVTVQEDGASPKRKTCPQKTAPAAQRLKKLGDASVRPRSCGSAKSGGRGQGRRRHTSATDRETPHADDSSSEHSGSESELEWERLEREMMSLL